VSIGRESEAGREIDEKTWKLITWGLGILGVIIFYAAGPRDNPRVVHWARLSVAFFIAGMVGWIAAFALAPVPVLGAVASAALWIGLLGVWLIGLLKVLSNEEWRPPVLSSMASRISIP